MAAERKPAISAEVARRYFLKATDTTVGLRRTPKLDTSIYNRNAIERDGRYIYIDMISPLGRVRIRRPFSGFVLQLAMEESSWRRHFLLATLSRRRR